MPTASTPLLFVSREPVTHERHGSTTAVHNLLRLLARHGASITVLVTLAFSRSPRLYFRSTFALPAGCTLLVPGYLRVGDWFVRPFSLRAWARLALRICARFRGFHGLGLLLRKIGGDRVFGESWDLTPATAAETAQLALAVRRTRPDAVIANYAFWGPALAALAPTPRRRAILMHDLLSGHCDQFRRAGMVLDCNLVTPEMEWQWLNGADTLIPIQRSEAALIRKHVCGGVFPQPIELPSREASVAPEPLRCLFVGSNSPPNVQGLHWLLDEVWPLVLAEEPAAVLAVVGTVSEKLQIDAPRVQVLGRVDSLDAEHNRASACLVPLRVGTGIKIKLLEALSFGKACVSTSVGVQGLEDWAKDAIAVADTPKDFAAELLRLLRDPALRRERERAATALVRREFAAGCAAEVNLLHRLLGDS